MMPLKRKKWTEAEEKTLIDKYGEMVSDGTLSRMKTREKKFKPVAFYVNSVHHFRDHSAFPWQWTWKDVSTKVQNMRHQYLLVKQKIKKSESSAVENSDGDSNNPEEYGWIEGVTHWSNFLRYKDVFGDLTAACSNHSNELMAVSNGGLFHTDVMEFSHIGHSEEGDFSVGIENGVMGFDYDGDECENNDNGNGTDKMKGEGSNLIMKKRKKMKKKKKKRKMAKGLEAKPWNLVKKQLVKLKDMEARFEKYEVERERERQMRESLRMEMEWKWEKKMEEWEKERVEKEKAMELLRKQRVQDWEALEESQEMERRRRREEELNCEREWEDRMNKRRLEWKKRIDETLGRHQEETGQIQARIIHEQQNLTGQLLGFVSQWTAHQAGISDHASSPTTNHYISHMMQNLHHVNGTVHSDSRVEGENQDDHFIVG